jgi:hypothetical protein
MSLLQFIVNLLAGFIEKDIIVGGKKNYLFEYDYSLDDGTLVSVKTNGNEIKEMLPGFSDFAAEAIDEITKARS